MRKWFCVLFLCFATNALAASDIVATYKYSDGNMITIVTRDKNHVRMDTSPTSYMLLQADTVYSVYKDGSGQWMAMDMGRLKQMNSQNSPMSSLFGGTKQKADAGAEYSVKYEKTGQKEKIAGYTGVVYNVEIKQGSEIVRRDEVVLSTHSDIEKVNNAWISMGEKMSQSMGDEMAKSLENVNREAKQSGYGGMLRYGDEMKLDNLKKMSLNVSYYQLPEGVQQVQMNGMPGMPDTDQMQQQYGQQEQYEQQQQDTATQQVEQQPNTQDQQGTAGRQIQNDAEDVGQAAHQEAKDQTVDEVKEGVKKLFDSLFN